MTKILVLLALGVVSPILAACSSSPSHLGSTTEKPGKFSLYLLSKEMQSDRQVDDLQCGSPADLLLSVEDILTYSAETPKISLTSSAYEPLSRQELAGDLFLVCIGEEQIYSGEFMAAYMSRSSDRVVILWPPINDGGQTIAIQLGYRGPDFFAGDDPRSDPRIMESLQAAGKLKLDKEAVP